MLSTIENQTAHYTLDTFCEPGFQSAFTERERALRTDNFTSSAVVMNAGALQRCIPGSLLYSHFTHDCIAKYDRDRVIKFVSSKTDRGNSE